MPQPSSTRRGQVKSWLRYFAEGIRNNQSFPANWTSPKDRQRSVSWRLEGSRERHSESSWQRENHYLICMREQQSNCEGSFQEIQRQRPFTASSEYNLPDGRREPADDYSVSGFLFLDKSDGRYSPYHSRRVIARSGSGSPLNHKFRTLARATSSSLTTRIPKALELSSRLPTSLCGGSQPNNSNE